MKKATVKDWISPETEIKEEYVLPDCSGGVDSLLGINSMGFEISSFPKPVVGTIQDLSSRMVLKTKIEVNVLSQEVEGLCVGHNTKPIEQTGKYSRFISKNFQKGMSAKQLTCPHKKKMC